MIDPTAIAPFAKQSQLQVLSCEHPEISVAPVKLRTSRALAPPVLSWNGVGRNVPLAHCVPPAAEAPLFIASVERAAVAVLGPNPSSYLLSADGQLVSEALDPGLGVQRRAKIDRKELRHECVVHPARDEHVLTFAGQRRGYWHWWIDALSRIWMSDEHNSEQRPLRLATPPLSDGFLRQSLECLGLLDRVVELKRGITPFARVSFTPGLTGSSSRWPATPLRSYAAWLRERLGLETTAPRRRLLISRADARWRRIVNQEQLATELAELGFETIECGRMPLREQIETFAEAEFVVGAHGAGLTNALFAPPGTRVLEIFAADNARDPSNYRVLASHLGFPYGRLLGDPVHTRPRGGSNQQDLAVDVATVRRAVVALGA